MHTLNVVGFIVIVWVLPCWYCWSEGRKKNRLGLAYGLCLSWLGVAMLSLMRPAKEPSSS